MITVVEMVNMKVWPSGSVRFSSAAASEPPAPARLSTSTC